MSIRSFHFYTSVLLALLLAVMLAACSNDYDKGLKAFEKED